MRLEHGLPQYLKFSKNLLPDSGDFSRWEEGYISKNGWFDIEDKEPLSGLPSKWYNLHMLRYRDFIYEIDINSDDLYLPSEYLYRKLHFNIEPENGLIPWPITREFLSLSPIAIVSEKQEFLHLIEYIYLCHYLRNTQSDGRIPNISDILNFQISGPNKMAIFGFIQRQLSHFLNANVKFLENELNSPKHLMYAGAQARLDNLWLLDEVLEEVKKLLDETRLILLKQGQLIYNSIAANSLIVTKQSDPDPNKLSTSLDMWFTETGKPLIPLFLRDFTGKKPADIASIINVLTEEGLFENPYGRQERLHKDLKEAIGFEYTRQTLGYNLDLYSRPTKTESIEKVNNAKRILRKWKSEMTNAMPPK